MPHRIPARVGVAENVGAWMWNTVQRPSMTCADATPSAAPPNTSLSQCSLSFTRDHAVAVAAAKRPTHAHGWRISSPSAVANANAIVAWPDGNASERENGVK